MKMAVLLSLISAATLLVLACGSSDPTATPASPPASPGFNGILQAPTGNELTPDFTLPLATGGTINFADYRGEQPVAVIFYRGFF